MPTASQVGMAASTHDGSSDSPLEVVERNSLGLPVDEDDTAEHARDAAEEEQAAPIAELQNLDEVIPVVTMDWKVSKDYSRLIFQLEGQNYSAMLCGVRRCHDPAGGPGTTTLVPLRLRASPYTFGVPHDSPEDWARATATTRENRVLRRTTFFSVGDERSRR